MRATKLITISLPAELLDETQRAARQEGRSRSEVIRGALRQYLASGRRHRVRRWGSETAERLGLKTEDDLQRLLENVRAGRRRTAR
jgi:Arc/MetJ-type ribon-helix-helix transcriptional regulator